MKAGDKKTVTITFPAEFRGRSGAGRKDGRPTRWRSRRCASACCPPLDAEFFKAHQVEDLERLKAQVRGNLKMQKEMRNRAAQRRQVTDALAAKADFAVPQSLVEAETQDVLRQFIEENMRRGVPAEQFEKDKKELFAERAAGRREAGEGRSSSWRRSPRRRRSR